jgi:hypothetical protein
MCLKVESEWHTDVSVRTAADGTATLRGFLGEYEITVTHGGKQKAVFQTLEKGAGVLTLHLF